MNKRLKWALEIVLAAVIALYAVWVLLPMPRDNCVITVSATFRVYRNRTAMCGKRSNPFRKRNGRREAMTRLIPWRRLETAN